jgi:uncharacterized protein (TIGR04255 family)
MPPTFPAVDRIELAVPMLELVVCQMRFPPVLELANHPPAEFQRRVHEEYPVALIQGQDRLEVGGDVAMTVSRSLIWAFQDRQAEWTVSLAPTFLALETTHYIRFEEFIRRFLYVIEIARETYLIDLRERLGLRYVDRISRENHPQLPDDWTDHIRPEVIPLRAFRGADEPQMGTLEARFKFGDRALAVRSLYTDRGFSNVAHDQLILDFDCYTDERGDLNGIDVLLREYKEITYRAFRWTLGDLIGFFGRADEEQAE